MEKLSEIITGMEIPSQSRPTQEMDDNGKVYSIDEYSGNYKVVNQGKFTLETVLAKYGVPLKFRKYSFNSFKGNSALVEKLREHCQQKPLPDTTFTGKTGSGKTHLAVAMLRDFVEQGRQENKTIKFITAIELLLEIRSSFDNERENEFEMIKRYSNYGLLLIDDLGAEKISDWSTATLYLILNKRYSECKPTIITSNLAIEEINDQLSSRIASRLSEGKIFRINMPDYRKIKGIK